jgi:Na+-transporting NADH:ubiquinone oxidoreductase subunit NqrC
MATFITDLVNSIFTPGPTPSLLIATNVSFACLQFLLLALLIATYSIHFVILSGLCAGLWWSINWFVSELRVAEARERENEKEVLKEAEDVETDTDVETVVDAKLRSSVVDKQGGGVTERKKDAGSVKVENLEKSRSDVSTEDEWERVSENEKDK